MPATGGCVVRRILPHVHTEQNAAPATGAAVVGGGHTSSQKVAISDMQRMSMDVVSLISTAHGIERRPLPLPPRSTTSRSNSLSPVSLDEGARTAPSFANSVLLPSYLHTIHSDHQRNHNTQNAKPEYFSRADAATWGLTPSQLQPGSSSSRGVGSSLLEARLL